MDRTQLLNDAEAATIYALDGRQARIWTAMPCIVQSVDFDQMTITAQPAIMGVQTNGDGTTENINMPLLVDVPLCFPSAGGFLLTLPISSGDEVLVILASRCIDSWWQSGGVGVAPELRMHDLSDGFALPGPRSLPNVVSAISPVNAQLRNDSGTTYLEITPTGLINLVAPAGVTVEGNLAITGGLTVTGNVVGDLTITGNVVVDGEVTAGAIPLTTHVHTGVQTGGGHTGGPIP
jgi:Phage protein Gp138 N-terminal domain